MVQNFIANEIKNENFELLKRSNRNNTGNRRRNKTLLVAKLDIFLLNLTTNVSTLSGEIGNKNALFRHLQNVRFSSLALIH